MALKVVEPDGTIRDSADIPNSFLPDGTGFRVLVRFITSGEGLSTYDGLRANFATYADVLARYATYEEIRADSSLGINVDFDITCLVSGVSLTSGKQSIFEDIESATANITIRDPKQMFDPRLTGIFGPGRRVRSGNWMRVEAWSEST